MSRDEVMTQARAAGLTVTPCASPDHIAVRAGEAPRGSNERLRVTADGALLTVDEGYYWQVGTVDDGARYVETMQ